MTKLKVAFLIVLGFLVTGCEQKSKSTPPEEGYITGNITILADESLEPIVAEEEYVFESLFPDAKLNIRFLSENALLNSFLNDSIRVAIVSRKLTPAENKILVDRKLPPIVSRFAVDAVALIVNKASADTLITVSEIKKMLKDCRC
ncbi:MAG: hypothetical protein EOP47_26145 [Sphingobacteriaceae bacterium]|nr:MAG: hypothetical protein EOP47_26145 [Sphingobacteriaceae bacterium]